MSGSEEIAENANCLAQVVAGVFSAYSEYDAAICCSGRECCCEGVSVFATIEPYLVKSILSHLQATPSGDVVPHSYVYRYPTWVRINNGAAEVHSPKPTKSASPSTTPPSNQEATLRKMGENAAQAAKDYAADIQALTERNQESEKLLRRAKELISKASTMDWKEDRCVMSAVHLAGDINSYLKDLPQ